MVYITPVATGIIMSMHAQGVHVCIYNVMSSYVAGLVVWLSKF